MTIEAKPDHMTNDELVAAIEAAFQLIQRMSSASKLFNTTAEHYAALLAIQKRRAEP